MSRTKLNVLLVEDNPGDVGLIREYLRDLQGAECLLDTVSTLGEAVHYLGQKSVDVLLLDLGLPDGGGLKNIHRIRGCDGKVPIVVLTGLDSEEVAVRALREGAQDYLTKGNIDGPLIWRSLRYAIERKTIEDKLKESKREAEQAARAKAEFLAHMSHEIRTPLHLILGAADAMAHTPLTPEQKKYADLFKSSGGLLLSLLNDLLDFSKLEAGKMSLQPRPFLLKEFLGELHDFLALSAQQKGNRLSFQVDPDVPDTLIGDAARLRQVLFNLLSNAVKFTRGGEISLKVALTDSESNLYRFSVRDTGMGIPRKEREQIFQAFSQSSLTRGGKHGGTGLGLSICHKLVGIMGGKIQVTSELDKGSEFSVTLPLEPVRLKRIPLMKDTPAGSASDGGDQKPLKLLLVEDSEDARFLMREYLKKTPVLLEEAENGETALKLCASKNYDLVFLDKNLPDMDGLECLKKLKKISSNGSSPQFVALTAYADEAILRAFREEGCAEVLVKPVAAEEVWQVVRVGGETLPGPGKERGPSEPHKKTGGADPGREPNTREDSLSEAIPGYLRRKREQIGILLHQDESEMDWEAIRRAGHQLKGTGGGYGFPELSAWGGKLEAGAADKNVRRVREALLAVENLLKTFEKQVGA